MRHRRLKLWMTRRELADALHLPPDITLEHISTNLSTGDAIVEIIASGDRIRVEACDFTELLMTHFDNLDDALLPLAEEETCDQEIPATTSSEPGTDRSS